MDAIVAPMSERPVLQAQLDRYAVRFAAQATLGAGHDLPDEAVAVAVFLGPIFQAEAHGIQLLAGGRQARGIEAARWRPICDPFFARDRIGQHVPSPNIGNNWAQSSPVLAKSQPPPTKIAEAGARLREERGRLGLNQADFAGLGEVSLNSQTRYESGSGSADIAYLLKLGVHGVDIAYVVSGHRSQAQLSEAESALVNAARGLSPRQRAILIQFLSSLTTSEQPDSAGEDSSPP